MGSRCPNAPAASPVEESSMTGRGSVVKALFEDLVRSYQEDFDMELAEATEEAKRELNMRGLAYVGDSHKSQKLPDPPCLSLLEEMVEYSKKRNVQRMLVLSESLLVFDKIEFIPQSALPSPVCLGLLTSATLLGEEPTGLGASSAILKILLVYMRSYPESFDSSLLVLLLDRLDVNLPRSRQLASIELNFIMRCMEIRPELSVMIFESGGFQVLLQKLLGEWDDLSLTVCKIISAVVHGCRQRLSVSNQSLMRVCSDHLVEKLVAACIDDLSKPIPSRRRAILNLINRMLINEALCKRFIDARLLFAITETIKTSSDTAQLKLCLSCLRTLSNTQQGKEEICQSGVLEPAFKLLSGNSEVVRQAVMFLAALCIRHSESTRRMRIGGCFEKVIDVMSGNLKNGDLQRSCCILVRNGAAQDEKIKGILLAEGAEDLLRLAKRSHPEKCLDVGSAALRDLGCTNYNEGWKPRTVVLGIDGDVIHTDEL